eukprot:Nitzschia sp. Nitz4//scaffold101_size76361//51804//52298//NITZ4_005607-RA/size76361-snap-gene-0.4-mRNA-1//1//CDS//3329532173//760//frame0
MDPTKFFDIIAGILVVNGVLGFLEEYHTKKSLDEVPWSIISEISVRRDGKMTLYSPSYLFLEISGQHELIITLLHETVSWLVELWSQLMHNGALEIISRSNRPL